MAHAQRLLPIEQLLSDAAASSGSGRSGAIKSIAATTEVRRSEPTTQARSGSVSPFAADSARKGNPKAEASGDVAAFADKHALSAVEGSVRATHPSGLTSANIVIMGSAAPAVAELSPAPDSQPVERREIKVEVRADRKSVVNAQS